MTFYLLLKNDFWACYECLQSWALHDLTLKAYSVDCQGLCHIHSMTCSEHEPKNTLNHWWWIQRVIYKSSEAFKFSCLLIRVLIYWPRTVFSNHFFRVRNNGAVCSPYFEASLSNANQQIPSGQSSYLFAIIYKLTAMLLSFLVCQQCNVFISKLI